MLTLLHVLAAARARRVLSLLVLAVLLAGCSEADSLGAALDTSVDVKPRAETVSAAPGSNGETEATVGVSPPGVEDSAAEPDGPPAGAFTAATQASGGAGFDADTVLAVRYGVHEGYDRVVLDLGVGEEPAAVVPRWTLVSPEGDGLLRVNLPSASVTNVSGGGFGDGLLKSFHVVRAPEDGMFVDIFARRAFRYRVLDLEDPARLVVDFEPAGIPLEEPLPASGGNTVLVEPRSGDWISDPITVSGYSRNFEAANTIILKDAGGKVLVRKTVMGNDWSTTWGYFEATLDLPPFSGRGTLSVGTASARDGSFEGVEIPVKGR